MPGRRGSGLPRTMGEAPKWRNWQTRRTQNPVPFGECGFDSHLRHLIVEPKRRHRVLVFFAAGQRRGQRSPRGTGYPSEFAGEIGTPTGRSRRLLGHHSWDFTAGTYVHLDDDDLPDGAIVGDLIAGETPPLLAAAANRP